MQVTGKPIATSVGAGFLVLAILAAVLILPDAKNSQSPLLYVVILGGLFVGIPAILGIAVIRGNRMRNKLNRPS